MTQEKATATWTKDAPTAEGVYWWRDSAVDNDPDVHLVQGEFFYQVGFASSELVANFGGEWLGPITPEQVSERNALLSEVATLRTEALKGICVYCGYVEQYESLEQKAGEEGNAMRVGHIRQCEARPEVKLIAFSEQLIDEVARLREALEGLRQRHGCFCELPPNVGSPDHTVECDRARAALAGKDR
jgi:hypothetical protein